MFLGQHEYLVCPKPSPKTRTSFANLRERLVYLCQRWGRPRDVDDFERALLVERSEAAILDTGASRTGVGKDNFQRFTDHLAKSIRDQIRTSVSQVVFRFGNNGTLPTLFTAFIPCGK